MLNTGYFLDSSFLIGPPMDYTRCSLFWDHISLVRSSWTPREVDSLVFSHGKSNSKKKVECAQSLYTVEDFQKGEAFAFVDERIKGRDNFLISGSSDVGKSQLVSAVLFNYFKSSSRYLVVSTKEEFKLIHAGHHSIIFDDFEWDTLSKEEIIRLLDRDRPTKMITCKFENATLYNYQQIIVVCNDIPDIFVEAKPIQSRILIYNKSISEDLRERESLFRRSTHRGNHLLQYSNEVNMNNFLPECSCRFHRPSLSNVCLGFVRR